MTAMLRQSGFEISRTTVFASARSDWLDRFSRLEVSVMRCADQFSSKPLPRGMPLSQRLARITSLTTSSAGSPEVLKKLQMLADECLELLPRRATIIHSTMKVGKCDGTDVALFQNGVDVAANLPVYVVMTEEDFVVDQRVLQSLTDRFSSLLPNPSWPPPPRPA